MGEGLKEAEIHGVQKDGLLLPGGLDNRHLSVSHSIDHFLSVLGQISL